MAFRHFGNIVSGAVITTLVYWALTVANRALFGWLPGVIGEFLSGVPFLTVGVPAAISLYFDWFGSAIQAYIFCMLTMMFISSATDE
jgi:F-type H+-transporting ATPase subunit a